MKEKGVNVRRGKEAKGKFLFHEEDAFGEVGLLPGSRTSELLRRKSDFQSFASWKSYFREENVFGEIGLPNFSAGSPTSRTYRMRFPIVLLSVLSVFLLASSAHAVNIGATGDIPNFPAGLIVGTSTNVQFNSGAGLVFPDGSTQTTGFTGTATVNAGQITPGVFGSLSNKGNYTFQLAGNTNPVLFVDATNGRVGVGNAAPSYPLDVTGNIRSTGTVYANANGAAYFCGGDDTCLYDINVANTMGVYGAQNSTVGSIKLGSGGGIISGSGGNIGIATTTPAYPLTVVGNAYISGSLNVGSINTGQGANELYAMNQNVQTTDSPTFVNLKVVAGTGNGICFWADCTNYKIYMGSGAEYDYGPVTDYSIKMSMNSTAGRGWTWGQLGIAPIAALGNTGNMQIAGTFTAASLSGSGSGLTGTAASLTSGATNFVNGPDGDRNAATKLPTTSPHGVRFDFVNANTANGGGNYSGLMTYAPYDGTSGSTGDASYQIAFDSPGTNASGIPYLSIRNGIDSTWNPWYTMLNSGNYGSYAPTLTGGGASGTWGINVTGNSSNITAYTINQNLGTGNSPTFAGLTVNGNAGVSGTVTAGASAILGSNIAAGYYQDASNGAYRSLNVAGNTGYYFQNYNGAATTMYVGLQGAYAGNVGIGGTYTPGYRLTVTGGAIGGNYGLTPNYAAWSAYGTGDGGAAIYNDNGTYQALMIVGNTSAGGVRQVGVWDKLTVNGDEAVTGNLNVGGNVTYGGTVSKSSDRRLKENIKPITNALTGIEALKPVTFNWKKDGTPSIGFIAQDVQKVYPQLVVVGNDASSTLSLDYTALIAPTVAAVQEQQKEIEALKAENASLETRMAALEEKIMK